MKHIFFSIISLLAVSAAVFGQSSKTYDIATFTPPPGWNEAPKEHGVFYSTADKAKNQFAVIMVFKSETAAAEPKANFDADWQRLVVETLEVKAVPEMEPLKQAGGWAILTGGASFDGDLGKTALILSTYTGFGRKFSVAAVFNNQEYIPAVDAFASSIVLSKPAAAPATPAAAATAASNADFLGTWGKQAGVHVAYGDPVSAGMSGYTKDQYTFNPDGTYTFVSKTFRNSSDKIILVRESGTFQTTGKLLVVSPQKSVIQSWSKLNGTDKFGRLVGSQARPLEKTVYRFTKHYFSGIQLWNLVLQSDSPTERDGPFSNNTLFTNAWYYSPISSNNPVIDLP